MAMEFKDCSEVELEKPLLFTAKDYATEYHTGVTTVPLSLATVFGRRIAYGFAAYMRIFWIYLSRFFESIPLICIPWLWFVKWIYPLDEETLLRQAQKGTELEDYGDESFREPLRILLNDLETEGRLNCMGRSLARTYMQRNLGGRLQLMDVRKRFPEIEEVPLAQPVFIVGMMRTGTTFLFDLLANDTSTFRTPLTWESHFVYPPPDESNYDCDPRIEKTKKVYDLMCYFLPELMSKHPVGAKNPQECLVLMSYTLASLLFYIQFHAPNYLKWFMEADLTPTYQFLRWQLQYLSWRGPRAPVWLLKCPAHIHHMPALLKAFPDAKFIMTHRDPIKVTASVCSLISTFQSLYTEHADIGQIAEEYVPHVASGLKSLIDVRQPGADGSPPLMDSSRFIDIKFNQLMKNPMGEVQRIYEFIGEDLSITAEKSMAQHMTKNKRPKHKYNWDDTRLDRATERARFKFYTDFFEVPEEKL